MSKTIVIIGPTASGKSAHSLALAPKNNAAILSADAFQIYREFNIGTGKLTHDQMGGISHYLIDEKDPTESYSVQEFLDRVSTITQSNNHPSYIICGGSALYLRALLYGYHPLKRLPIHERPDGDPEHLWHQLYTIDPALAERTPYQNKARVQRYLELHTIYQCPPSELFQSSSQNTDNYKVIGLMIENEVLRTTISHRVDAMINMGLVDEVNYLMKKYDISCSPFRAIGYKETLQYLNGAISKDTLITQIKHHSYQYAKRQMTWFKGFDNVQWIKK